MAGDAAAEMKKFAEALVRMKLAYPHQLRGCSQEEVARVVESAGGFALPEHYLAFLTKLGREAGRLLIGTDFYYPVVLKIPGWAAEFVAEDAPTLHLEGRHFFASHQGYQYYFFDQKSPGKVFLYSEGDAVPTPKSATFLEFLWEQARAEASVPMTGIYANKYPS